MNPLLAVDPGLLYPAASLFITGELQAASRVKVSGSASKLPIAERCRLVGQLIREWYDATKKPGDAWEPEVLVVEWPKIYTADKSEGDPNDLLGLAGINCAVATLFPHAKVLSPIPREWTGNVKKSKSGDPWASPRGIRIRSRLSDLEVSRVIPSHDAVDAVGLGLWALGRFERRRVYETG